jgi:hypothetical protein
MDQTRSRSTFIEMNPPPRKRWMRLFWQVGWGILISCCCSRADATEALDPSKLPAASTVTVDFTRDIKPILENSCLRCHGPEKPKSRFRLDVREAALKGGENGIDIIPGSSAKSPLVFYVAGLVLDMEMPPTGKGTPLTTNQVALVRAWIDQGVRWATNSSTDNFVLFMAPTVGDTKVDGNEQKFRELFWEKDGVNGGLEEFTISSNASANSKYTISGYVLADDYRLNLSVNRTDLGFVRSGWEQYRKYYDGTGGLSPLIKGPIPQAGGDLYLDIGKAWVDFGLTLPNWPQLVLGYEYDYKRGTESELDWNALASSSQRNTEPATEKLDESVHVIKFELTHEIGGVAIDDRFRGEFYDLKTDYTNVDARGAAREDARETDSYFQGANTLRLEKKFNDWFYGSAGYLYSKLNSDASFTDFASNGSPHSPVIMDIVPQVTLERESHVFNLNGMLGSFGGVTLSAGVEEEWTREHGFSGSNTFLNPVYTNGLNTLPPITIAAVPTILSSDYDQNTVTETVALRYSKIPFTSLFVDARLQQETIAQYDDDFQPASGFAQDTCFSSQLADVRAGFSTSPWRSFSFSGHYRRYDNSSQYNNDSGMPPPESYPGFILARDLLTDELEGKVTWRPRSWFTSTITCQYTDTHYTTDTDPVTPGVSPGGTILAGKDISRIYSINSTFIPMSRLYLSGTFSYQPTVSTSAANSVPTIVPYRGDIYNVLASGVYSLGDKTSIFANFTFSEADYAQDNFTAEMPVGIEYQLKTIGIGIARRFGNNLIAKVQYGYDTYEEPSSGAANNFRAQSVFGTISWRLP